MEMCLYPPRTSKTRDHPRSNPAGSNFSTSDSKQQTASGRSDDNPNNTNSINSSSGSALPLPWSCSDESLLRLVASRDPTGVGLEGGLALRLLQRLLAWDPKQRPTAAQALQHAYFTTPRRPSVKDGGGQQKQNNKKQHQQGMEDDSEAADSGSDGGSGDDSGSEGGSSGGGCDAVRLLLQEQEAVLTQCCGVPLGEPGWC